MLAAGDRHKPLAQALEGDDVLAAAAMQAAVPI